MSDRAGSRLRLTLEPSPAAPSAARLFVAEAARVAGLSERVITDLRLAVSEVVNDALNAPPERIGIEVVVTPGRVEVTGPPSSTDGHPEPTPSGVLAGIPTVQVERTSSATRLVAEER